MLSVLSSFQSFSPSSHSSNFITSPQVSSNSIQPSPSNSYPHRHSQPQTMGLIKSAIYTGGALYAVNKLGKAYQQGHQQQQQAPQNGQYQNYNPQYQQGQQQQRQGSPLRFREAPRDSEQQGYYTQPQQYSPQYQQQYQQQQPMYLNNEPAWSPPYPGQRQSGFVEQEEVYEPQTATRGQGGDQFGDMVREAMGSFKGARGGEKSGKKNKMMDQLFA